MPSHVRPRSALKHCITSCFHMWPHTCLMYFVFFCCFPASAMKNARPQLIGCCRTHRCGRLWESCAVQAWEVWLKWSRTRRSSNTAIFPISPGVQVSTSSSCLGNTTVCLCVLIQHSPTALYETVLRFNLLIFLFLDMNCHYTALKKGELIHINCSVRIRKYKYCIRCRKRSCFELKYNSCHFSYF